MVRRFGLIFWSPMSIKSEVEYDMLASMICEGVDTGKKCQYFDQCDKGDYDCPAFLTLLKINEAIFPLEFMDYTITVLEINNQIESFIFTPHKGNLNICSKNSSTPPTKELVKIVRAITLNKVGENRPAVFPDRTITIYKLTYAEWKFLFYYLNVETLRKKFSASMDITMRVLGHSTEWLAVNACDLESHG